jgi:hypothetical protein
MADRSVSLGELLPEKVVVDEKEISDYTREGQFTSLAVELLKETAIMTSILACSYQLDESNKPRKWTTNEAVLVGLMVRLSKLQSGFLDQVCQHRREIADVILRPLFENIINLSFLLKHDGTEMIEEYIEYSLRTEKRLLVDIEENIKDRDYELPIEKRMKTSIMHAFEKSGIPPERVDEKSFRTWGGNIRKRSKAVGMEDAYLALMSLPSHPVHGNWQDLITHHLGYENGAFYPKTAWTQYRPQGIFTVAMLSVEVNSQYSKKMLPHFHEPKDVEERLTDLKKSGLLI